MAHIVLLSVATDTYTMPEPKWNQYQFWKPQAHIDQMMIKPNNNSGNGSNSSNRIIFNLILFIQIFEIVVLFHRYMHHEYISIFVYLLLFNSFDKFVNNQFLTMKYSKLLLAFACLRLWKRIRICKFDACRHFYHIVEWSILCVTDIHSVYTPSYLCHIWKSLLNITKYRSKNNMHFSIHVQRVHSLFPQWFVILSQYKRQK